MFGASILLMSQDEINHDIHSTFDLANKSLATAFRVKDDFLTDLLAVEGNILDYSMERHSDIFGLNAEIENHFYKGSGALIPLALKQAVELDSDADRLISVINNTSHYFRIQFDPLSEVTEWAMKLQVVTNKIRDEAKLAAKKASSPIKETLESVSKKKIVIPQPDINTNATLEDFDAIVSRIMKVHYSDILQELANEKRILSSIIFELPTNPGKLAKAFKHAYFVTEKVFINEIKDILKGVSKAFPEKMEFQLFEDITLFKNKAHAELKNLYITLTTVAVCTFIIVLAFVFTLCLTCGGIVFPRVRRPNYAFARCGLRTLVCCIYFGTSCLIIFWIFAVIGFLFSLIPLIICDSFHNGTIFEMTTDSKNFWTEANGSASAPPWANAMAPHEWDVKFKTALLHCKEGDGMYETLQLNEVFPQFYTNLSGTFKPDFSYIRPEVDLALHKLPYLNLSVFSSPENNISTFWGNLNFELAFLNLSHFLVNLQKSYNWPRLWNLLEQSEIKESLKYLVREAESVLLHINSSAMLMLDGRKDYLGQLSQMNRLIRKTEEKLEMLKLQGERINEFINITASDAILAEIPNAAQDIFRGIELPANDLMYHMRHNLTQCQDVWNAYQNSTEYFCKELLSDMEAAWLGTAIICVFMVPVILLGVLAANIFEKLIGQNEDSESATVLVEITSSDIDVDERALATGPQQILGTPEPDPMSEGEEEMTGTETGASADA